MARRTIPLTDREIKSFKAKEKDYKKFDGGGLFLLVTKAGGKHWKMKYKNLNGKEDTYPIGTYPTISLNDARLKREEIKVLLAQGIDPKQKDKEAKTKAQEQKIKNENTFKKVALEWHESYKNAVTSEKYYGYIIRRLENHIFPTLGEIPIDNIKPTHIIEQLEILKNKKKIPTARRIKESMNKIFKYAITYQYCENNPVAGIDSNIILGKNKEVHYPEIQDPKAVLASIDEYKGQYFTKKALQLLPYTMLRSSNIRLLEWSEVDFIKKQLLIPAHKMKVKEEFILPLSRQALAILEEVKENNISERYVFPSPNYNNRALSDNTLNSAFRRMGYSKEEIVSHSFRNLFSTICYENLNDHNIQGEVIEALLHHQEKNQVKKAYNRAKYIEPKKELIQWYADYLDSNYR